MRLLATIFYALSFTAPGRPVAPVDQPAATIIHAGPVFTQADDSGPYPHYPDVKIQVDIPPGTDPRLVRPEAFFLSRDGGTLLGAANVETMGESKYGVAAAFALDVSGSMKGGPLNAVRSGLTKFVGDAGTQDKIALETIADNSRWDANWEDSREQVRAALGRLAVRGNLTRLWDGLYEAIGRYPETPLSRRLIVISDGHDEGSARHMEDVVTAARANGIVIDAIGITHSNPAYLQGLSRLAAETGGVFRRANTTAELETLIGRGIERLRSTPVISYRLDDLKADGQMHRFEVIWKHESIESKSETTATLPATSSPSVKRSVFWWAGGGVLLLATLGVVLVGTRKRKPSLFPVPMAVSASIVKPEPVAASGFKRTDTLSQTPGSSGPVPPVQSASPLQEVKRMAQPPARRANTELLARFSSPSSEHPGAWLFAEEGPGAGTQFPLVGLESWIGALDTNQIPLYGDNTVSGNHACLVFDNDLLSVYDNSSTNGTWVNGEQIRGTRKLLRPDDRIRVGKSTFVVKAAPRDGARP